MSGGHLPGGGPDRRRRRGRRAGVILLLLPLPRTRRARIRLADPGAAARFDGVTGRLAAPLGLAALLCFALAALTSLPLYFAGVGVALLSGVPVVLDNRRMRTRLRTAPPPPQPLLPAAAEGPTATALEAMRDRRPADALAELGPLAAGDALASLWVRALAAAATGDERVARACALRCVQLDPAALHVLSDAGLLLCRHGRFTAGLRLLERAADAADDAAPGTRERARLALVEGRRLAGRLRDAVTALDGEDRLRLPRRPAPPSRG